MADQKNVKEVDLGSGSVGKLLFSLALPAISAQVINVLYNMVDRMYIGHLPDVGANALTGVGVTFPIIMAISAFAALVSMGGAPRASIMLGKGRRDEAEKILGNCTTALIAVSLVLTAVIQIFGQRILLTFGASGDTIEYAWSYMQIYSIGTIFVQLALGLNAFINAQGYARTGMLTVLIGAVCNIILDPILMFVLHMGVRGAALATIISQGISAAFVVTFLVSGKSYLKIRIPCLKVEKSVLMPAIALGAAPFVMQFTESILNICFNTSLQRYGGDLYVGSMTIMQSVMQMLVMPIQGITQGAQPIMSYNYGAKNYSRVRKTFSLLLKVMLLVTVSGFALAALLPGVLARMFTQDAELIEIVKKMMPIFFGGIWAFGAQMACQTTFMALGQAKISLFLALLRKVVLLVPLALLLPVVMGGNVLGIYIAEPVADVIASFTTLSLFLIKRKTLLPDGGAPAKSK